MEQKPVVEKIPEGGITSPQGFQSAGVCCGIKNNTNSKKDLAMIFSEEPAAAAGVFTRNLFQAAPVIISRERINNAIQAIVINSGNANACVGKAGYQDALEMGTITSQKMNVPEESILIASTGPIGQRLPMEKVREGIAAVSSELTPSPEGGDLAAQAILTTDTTIKKAAYRSWIGERPFVVGGMAKGSGMICPDMATMLAYITTDLGVDRLMLQEAFGEAASRSFNLISVDGDTSTNDMAVVLANGSSGLVIERENSGYELFCHILREICRDLAYQIIYDGEGATKVISLTVKGAPGYAEAKKIARAVLNSLLVKTAFFGEDANWGRIFAAMGYAGVPFDPHKVDLYMGSCKVASGGHNIDFNEKEVLSILQNKEVFITIDLGIGTEEIVAWGNDLSYEYVTINSEYLT